MIIVKNEDLRREAFKSIEQIQLHNHMQIQIEQTNKQKTKQVVPVLIRDKMMGYLWSLWRLCSQQKTIRSGKKSD